MRGASGVPVTTAPSDLAEMLGFHFLPTRYMDSTWWESDGLPDELFQRLRQSPRSHRHLSRFFLKRAGPVDSLIVDLGSAEARLALLSAPRLTQLARLAGVTLLSTTIARVLRGSDRSRIKAGIGTASYEFAIRSGRFVLQQARLKEAIPGVSLTDYGMVDEECRRLGVGSLATALQDAPLPWVRRAQLKLPRSLAERHWQALLPRPDEFLRLFELLNRQIPAT